jgi:hypothetical protein
MLTCPKQQGIDLSQQKELWKEIVTKELRPKNRMQDEETLYLK